jgi:hypothetical protein
MKNNITPNNLSTVLIRKPKYLLSDNTQNKSTNTLITDLINSNQRFNNYNNNIKKSESNESKKKFIYPYFYVKSRIKNYEIINKNKPKNKNYFLPVISNNKHILKSINKKKEINSSFKINKLQNKKRNELLINPVLLYLNTESSEKKGKIINNLFSNRNKGNKSKDDFLERVKDYRRQLKEQMIKRNKFQYSNSNKSFNKSQNNKSEREINKESKKEKENDEIRFNYNKTNKYIFKINENVDKSLNIFYNKLRSTQLLKYKTDKSLINYSNINSERNYSTSNQNEIRKNKYCTININK